MTLPSLLDTLKDRESPHGTVLAVSMMKDEAPFLLEWYAHHLAVGFTKILVYTNDCTDGTVEMLQRLEALGLGYHKENTIPSGIKPQPSAIKHAQNEPLVQNADWVLLFDADEFLVVSHPSGTLDGMISDAVARGANGIVITWRIFGSGGVVDWSRAPVTEQYLRAAPPLWNKGWGVKTLFKFDPEYWKLGIHRPSIKNKHLDTDFPQSVKWVNGSGLPMEDYFKFRGWRSIRRTLGYDWAQMNHYAIKSIDSYAVRKFRGNVNNKKDKYNAEYWSLQDRNEVEDRQILKHRERRAAIMDALLKDPVLAHYHEKALEAVEKRLADYKTTEAYHALKSDLIAAGKTPIGEVVAKPPKARDAAKIALKMSQVERREAERPKDQRQNLHQSGRGAAQGSHFVEGEIDQADDFGVTWFENHGIEIPADPRIFNPETLNSVFHGRYDRRHARNISGYLEGRTRVFQIGAGIGFIPMVAMRSQPDLIFLTQEDRATLSEIAAKVAHKNVLYDSSRLKLVHTPLVFEDDGPDEARGFAAYLRDFCPDVLRFGSYKAITPARLAKADLAHVMRVILPFDSEPERDELRQAYAPALLTKGFQEDEARAGYGSLQFEREI